ncbi:MAG: FAD-binding protein [Propionibacteriaceae bacterium]|jgi:succinate dehydrogenase/fumarate reductase flavoprotein subunit|nr:FAD-binding protein [Propionibacteriaceae bacterium]
MAPAPVTVDGRPVEWAEAGALVVGAGAAGLAAAVALAEAGVDVLLVTDHLLTGTSRNAGSDKQTYYKLTLAGDGDDSVAGLAATLFAGGAMDGDVALAEAAGSARAFYRLVALGVPFPQDPWGQFAGYKTDHDPRQRATSAGPYTSKAMVEALARRLAELPARVVAGVRAVDLVTVGAGEGGPGRVAGFLGWRIEASGWLAVRSDHVVWAVGGPAALYADRVYPSGQWGAAGAPLRAGAACSNVTEWQFGLASLRPRWNVSGSYMQVIPRFFSVDAAGVERDFLEADLGAARAAELTFLKGYQWPFDVRKAADGSSRVDLLVRREQALGRRVCLDFRRNGGDGTFDPDRLSAEARDYLARADALGATPVERLRRLNEPAYQLYLDKQPRVDLAAEPLEIGLCAQHNNGGLTIDPWWRTTLPGLYAVGEAAGSHGVYRPGGAALNGGQVGALRAAQWIARCVALSRGTPAAGDGTTGDFAAAAAAARARAERDVAAATAGEDPDHWLAWLQRLMSDAAGPVRTPAGLARASAEVGAWLARFPDGVAVDAASRRSVDRFWCLRDAAPAAQVYLGAMADYAAHGGLSRGSALYLDEGADPLAARPPLDGGTLDEVIQQVTWSEAGITARWRPRRPLPTDDPGFEAVWRRYRETGPTGEGGPAGHPPGQANSSSSVTTDWMSPR